MATMMASISPPHISPETNPSRSLFENCQSMNHLKQIHSQSIRRGLAYNPIVNSKIITYCRAPCGATEVALGIFQSMKKRHIISWTGIVTRFADAGQIDLAQKYFDQMPGRDFASWTAMIDGYLRLNQFKEVLFLFRALDKNHVNNDIQVANALIDMYFKCGNVEKAVRVFDKMAQKNKFTWTAMIVGHAINGQGKEALDMLSDMLKASITPDEVTYIGVLCACTRTGMVDDGRKFFSSMMTEHGIEPNVTALWVHALPGACRVHKNVEMAERQLNNFFSWEPEDSAVHVLLSNIYAACNRWENLRGVRKMMMDRGIKKTPGCSLIEMNGIVHEFVAGDHSHPQSEEIYSKLDEMIEDLKISRYLPNTLEVSLNIGEEENENVLNRHSEKLAIAFGMISSEPGVTIRIVKNLRMCVDCYLVATLVSRIYNREVIVRDSTLFHHFRNGSCCCKDYW
ncbi:pentatricopeptide repeat (PPR) superfamily protein [Actinidia rufa]|uniref:Pentatricopeptide repeat (PPR) superfamily protein n=1 Tax=Actinidia rufa TaxID=165716 RepID=A0A7J0FE13_9ERIC|nr:pentatricopeptide repeat (PPR) superfamily protein [Actinidia rufa]